MTERAGPRRPQRLRLAPEYRCRPLWDHERGDMIEPAGLGLSDPLVGRLEAWDAVYQATFRREDPGRSGFADEEAWRAWAEEGRLLAGALAREWEGELVVRFSGLGVLLDRAKKGLQPWDVIPEDRIPDIARHCGVAEIAEIIARLDALARAKAALPDWDGDSSDDVSRAQWLFARILGAVPARYVQDAARGLTASEPETRRWLALALELHGRDAALVPLRTALAAEGDPAVRAMLAETIRRLDAT